MPYSTPIINQVVHEAAIEDEYFALAREDQARIVQGMLLYILHGYDHKHCRREYYTNDLLTATHATQLRRAAVINGVLTVAFKQAVFRLLREPRTAASSEDRRRVFVECGLHPQDAPLWNLIQDHTAHLRMIASSFYEPPRGMADIQIECAAFVQSIEVWIKKFAYRKLRFVATSNNFSLDDIVNDLRIKAVSSYYQIYPKAQSLAHHQNMVKRSIHHDGMNIITDNTSKKRARLQYVPDVGFVNTIQGAITEKEDTDEGTFADVLTDNIARMQLGARNPDLGKVLAMVDNDDFLDELGDDATGEEFFTALKEYTGLNGPRTAQVIRDFVEYLEAA